MEGEELRVSLLVKAGIPKWSHMQCTKGDHSLFLIRKQVLKNPTVLLAIYSYRSFRMHKLSLNWWKIQVVTSVATHCTCTMSQWSSLVSRSDTYIELHLLSKCHFVKCVLNGRNFTSFVSYKSFLFLLMFIQKNSSDCVLFGWICDLSSDPDLWIGCAKIWSKVLWQLLRLGK